MRTEMAALAKRRAELLKGVKKLEGPIAELLTKRTETNKVKIAAKDDNQRFILSVIKSGRMIPITKGYVEEVLLSNGLSKEQCKRILDGTEDKNGIYKRPINAKQELRFAKERTSKTLLVEADESNAKRKKIG